MPKTNTGWINLPLLVSLPILGFSLSASAEGSSDVSLGLMEALKGGHAEADFRLRYEDVQRTIGPVVKGAQALTLRSRIAYETAQYEFFSAKLEVENVTALPNDDNYDSGSNNQTDDAFVPDPEGTELNQAWLAYDVANTLIKYGRQTVDLDNGRFIGTDTWRQNENTVSGFTLKNESLNFIRLRLGTLHRAETVLGDDVDAGFADVDANYVHLKYRGILNSFLSLYYIDIDNNDGTETWDSTTKGIRFAGKVDNEPAIEYILEYAKQSSSADNPVDYSATYYLIEAGVTVQGVKLAWGQEVLGADGQGFFVTPLAALDSYQGWTNRFYQGGLGNIRGGISDRYLNLGYSWAEDANVLLTHHVFHSDDSSTGGGNLGKEWGFQVSQKWRNYRYSVGYADYQADTFSDDTRVLWLSLGANF